MRLTSCLKFGRNSWPIPNLFPKGRDHLNSSRYERACPELESVGEYKGVRFNSIGIETNYYFIHGVLRSSL